ncbi:hypothetical protein BH11CYA1_BH11CYA1_42000 [soil metagenome]
MLREKPELIETTEAMEPLGATAKNFQLATSKIECDVLKSSLENPCAGALVCFEGVVRNHNEGKVVLSLEYEAYESLARLEASKIFAEAVKQYSILSAICVHRTGLLQIGETAVFVGVTSAHRDAAFHACRYIIDEIKMRLPIWKKETYEDGISEWVNCQHTGQQHLKDPHLKNHHLKDQHENSSGEKKQK